jgi:hypothetical protein
VFYGLGPAGASRPPACLMNLNPFTSFERRRERSERWAIAMGDSRAEAPLAAGRLLARSRDARRRRCPEVGERTLRGRASQRHSASMLPQRNNTKHKRNTGYGKRITSFVLVLKANKVLL